MVSMYSSLSWLYSSIVRSTGAAPPGLVSRGSLGCGLSDSGVMPLHAVRVVEKGRRGAGLIPRAERETLVPFGFWRRRIGDDFEKIDLVRTLGNFDAMLRCIFREVANNKYGKEGIEDCIAQLNKEVD
jgi:hypothetical protein